MNLFKGITKFSMLPVDLTEKILRQLYREKIFLKLVTFTVDNQLKFQERAQKRATSLFKFLKFPVMDDVEQISRSLIKLEKEFEVQKQELEVLKKEKVQKPLKRKTRKKTVPTAIAH